MARSRNIKPGFFKNELLGTSDPFVSLLFAGLWTLSDKAGILEDRPLRIKAELFPYREGFDINGYLTVLVTLGFILRYKIEGNGYILVKEFTKHQNPHHTEKESNYPKYTEGCEITVITPLNNRLTPADSLIPDSLNTDSLIPEKGDSQKFVLPDWIDKYHWDMWVKARKKMSVDQKNGQVEKLRKWKESGLDYAGALENAAINGTQGLFLPNVPRKHNSNVQEARLSVAQQIMGGSNGTKRQIIDITPITAIESDGKSIPKAVIGFRKSDAS